jgi:purine-binding chemotaxis protein CheW
MQDTVEAMIEDIHPDQFDLDAINKTLSERAERFSYSDDNQAENDAEEMIVFLQHKSTYAIPLRMLTELRKLSKLTPLPKTSDAIVGIINVRGRLVAVYKLNIDSDSFESSVDDLNSDDKNSQNDISSNKFVLIGHGVASEMAILADDIVGTREVSFNEIKQKPISLNDQDYIVGLGSDGLIFLDLERFVTNENCFMA